MMSRECLTELLRSICNQLWNEASLYLPSHHDLLGDLGDPAILGYQEGPEITHTETHTLSILYPKLLWISITTTVSPSQRYTPIHEQIHILTVSPNSSFTGDQADALSIKTFFPSLAVLHLWKADRSVGECDTHSLAWGSLGSFYKHPLKKEKVDTVALWGSV